MKIILFISFSLILLNGCKNSQPAIYYLPKNFQGIFAVIYSQNQGSDQVVEGRRQFHVPEDGILLTKFKFSDGWRNDIFLLALDIGFDTLKMYIPIKDSTGKRFDSTYYNDYTSDSNRVAINFKQIFKPTFNKFDLEGNEVGSCSFTYELITVGKASILNDSTGKIFIKRLNKYLKDRLCK